MFRNNGDGTFADVTEELSLGDPRWGGGGAFLDYDTDRGFDLFVANYAVWDPADEKVCTIRDTGARDILYHNNGNGTFTDVSIETESTG